MKKYIMSAMLFAGITATAQENMKTVSGHVTDAASGKPIAGVIVEAYGDARYTAMTDDKGQYELKEKSSSRTITSSAMRFSV